MAGIWGLSGCVARLPLASTRSAPGPASWPPVPLLMPAPYLRPVLDHDHLASVHLAAEPLAGLDPLCEYLFSGEHFYLASNCTDAWSVSRLVSSWTRSRSGIIAMANSGRLSPTPSAVPE